MATQPTESARRLACTGSLFPAQVHLRKQARLRLRVGARAAWPGGLERRMAVFSGARPSADTCPGVTHVRHERNKVAAQACPIELALLSLGNSSSATPISSREPSLGGPDAPAQPAAEVAHCLVVGSSKQGLPVRG
jgi:hypothetical protein